VAPTLVQASSWAAPIRRNSHAKFLPRGKEKARPLLTQRLSPVIAALDELGAHVCTWLLISIDDPDERGDRAARRPAPWR
jgi:hypothetical protein